MHQRKKRGWMRGGNDSPFIDPVFAEGLSSSRRRGESDSGRRSGWKTQMLCRQVQRAISLALAGECNDDVLRDLWVVAVVPAPDEGRLAVQVALPRQADVVALSDILERLGRAQGTLRRAVAEAITRKRAPELTFVPVAAGEVQP